MTGDEKSATYSALKVRLKKALAASFWFEACMIEYAIMEDRTSAILYHSGVFGLEAYSDKKQLKNKLNSITYQIGKKHPVISKKVSAELIQDILSWREKRNDTVHRACQRSYSEAEMEQLARTGNELQKKLDNAVGRVQRLAEKNKTEGKR